MLKHNTPKLEAQTHAILISGFMEVGGQLRGPANWLREKSTAPTE